MSRSVARFKDRSGGSRIEPPERFPDPVRRLSPDQRLLRGLLIVGCLAVAWWVAWLFDRRNLPGTALFVVVAGAQLLDLLATLGFWHAVWPRVRPGVPYASVQGRASVLVVAHGQPIDMVEQTLQAAVAMHRRHRVFLADPFERLDLRWLPSWYGARRLSPGMEELAGLAGGRFLAVFEAGQVPRPDFLEALLPYFADHNLAMVQAWYSRSGRRRSRLRDAVFRGADVLGEAPCVGSNYVVRRSALHSVGGLGPGEFPLAGSLRLGADLRANGWRARYVGAQLAESSGASDAASRLADYYRWTAAEAAITLRPGVRRRGASPAALLYSAWTGWRHLALVGLPVSALAVALAGAGTFGSLPPGWPVNLAVHLVPYLVVRTAIRLVAGLSRPVELPALQLVPEAPTGELEPPGTGEREAPRDIRPARPPVPRPQAGPEPLTASAAAVWPAEPEAQEAPTSPASMPEYEVPVRPAVGEPAPQPGPAGAAEIEEAQLAEPGLEAPGRAGGEAPLGAAPELEPAGAAGVEAPPEAEPGLEPAGVGGGQVSPEAPSEAEPGVGAEVEAPLEAEPELEPAAAAGFEAAPEAEPELETAAMAAADLEDEVELERRRASSSPAAGLAPGGLLGAGQQGPADHVEAEPSEAAPADPGSAPELEPAAMAGESEAPRSPEAGREPRPRAPLPWEAAPTAEPEPRPLTPRGPALRPAAAQASAAVAAPSRLRTGLRSVARLVTPSPREPEQPPVRPPAEAEPLEAWSPAEAGPEPEPAADVLPLPTGELGTATLPETALEPPAVSRPQPASEPDREPEPELASEPAGERKPEPASALKAPEPRSESDLLEPIWNVLDLLEQEPPAGSGPMVGPWRPAPRALGRRFPARPGLRMATVAWIVTAGALVAATLAVIQSNPPQPTAAVKRVAAPPYSYYAPVQAQPGAPQPSP